MSRREFGDHGLNRQFPGSAVAWVALLLVGGCQPAGSSTVDAETNLEFTPRPPRVGTAEIVLTLTDPAGQPLEAESLEVEGNMNHAGMKPVFSTLRPTAPGRYEGTLEFTMAGDWFVLVTGQLADGRRINEKVDVPGVERP